MAAKTAFELSLLGGAVEHSWRRARPEIERLPWESLDPAQYPRELVEGARRFWTVAAFQEHRSAAATAAAVPLLLAAGAPLDLVAMVSRFVVDELAHVELCARVAAQLGGGATLLHDPAALAAPPASTRSPLEAAAAHVVRIFCVGEAFSVRMQRATARAEPHPLLKAVIGRIARDEAGHGRFGWLFLDWAGDALDADARAHLRQVAHEAIAEFEKLAAIPASPPGPRLGWLDPATFATTARRALEQAVLAPLRARGLY